MTRIYLIITILIVFSCNALSQSEFERLKGSYSEIRSLYPKDLVVHLPKLNKNDLIFYEFEFPRGKYLNYIHIGVECTDKEISKIKQNMHPTKVYRFVDSCHMIVGYDSLAFKGGVIKMYMCNNFDNMLPIPNFSFLDKEGFSSNFYENATIYVLGAQKGKYLSDDCLSYGDAELPIDWKHGYSKGILISGNVVVYWLEVW